jgi:hypothetical protein
MRHLREKLADGDLVASIGSAPIVVPTERGIPVDVSGREGKRNGPGTQLTPHWPSSAVGALRQGAGPR